VPGRPDFFPLGPLRHSRENHDNLAICRAVPVPSSNPCFTARPAWATEDPSEGLGPGRRSWLFMARAGWRRGGARNIRTKCNDVPLPQTVICCCGNQLCCSSSKPNGLSGLGDRRPGRALWRLGFHGWRRERTGASAGRQTPAARSWKAGVTDKICIKLYSASMLLVQWLEQHHTMHATICSIPAHMHILPFFIILVNTSIY
jgi:hypothetical protein